MRLTRFRWCLLFGAVLLMACPVVVMAQPGGFQGGGRGGRGGGRGGRGGGRGGRGGGRQFDPSMFFNLLSGGKDYIVVADMLANPMISARDPNAKERIEAFMQAHGITDGRLTREQFALYMQERMAERQAARAAANPGGAGPPGAAPSDSAADSDGATEPPPVEEPRPVVYRAGKLPKELPPWFGQMDEDKDGQVGLYEWKKAGRSITEFEAMDLNGDGFITVEEALRYVKMQGKNVASNAPSTRFGGAPNFGGSPGMGGLPAPGGPSSFGRYPGGPPSFGGSPGGRPSFNGSSGGPPGQGNYRRRRRPDQ